MQFISGGLPVQGIQPITLICRKLPFHSGT